MTWTAEAMARAKEVVARIANDLIPGWSLEVVFADSLAQTGGALAYCIPTPRREQAKIVIAPHPPGERLEETVAHELGHAWVSPLVELIEPSEAAITIEEVLIERFCKFAAKFPHLAGALARVTRNPRTRSPIIRARISALATRRRTAGRKRMDPKALAALAMEGGQFAAQEGLPPEVAEWIKKVVEAMAGGAVEEAQSERSEALAQREQEGKDSGGMGGEKDMPPAARECMRKMRVASQSMLRDTIRMRLHAAKTVDGIVLDPATEKELAGATSIEQFEREFRLVTRQAAKATEQQRARSGVIVAKEESEAGAPHLEDLVKEGLPERQARDVIELWKKNRVAAQAELDGARLRLRGQAAGGA